MKRPVDRSRGIDAVLSLEGLALLFIAVPNAIFLHGWIVGPLGSIAALALLACVFRIIVRTAPDGGERLGSLWVLVVAVASAWCLIGGLGHFFYANSDWWVRDAVLLDLVRDPWPVHYAVDGVDLLLRAPVGYYLVPATIGKVFGIRVAELSMLVWTVVGVSMTMALMLRDRPGLRVASIRLLVFVFFSGMDIVPTVVRQYPYELGSMIEWWGRFYQYSSETTLLFWVPNHTLPGWIATAWLLGQDLRRFSIQRMSLFVVLSPLWAPLTAAGIAPLALAAFVWRLWSDRDAATIRSILDGCVVVVAAICLGLIYPYLVAGTGELDAGLLADMRWIGESVVQRYIEFILVEFVIVAAMLVIRQPRDPLLWVSIGVLLALPFFRFGPYNDLVMRTSIPALMLLAVRCGQWLAMPVPANEPPLIRTITIVALVVGAVTPVMELSRPFLEAPWPMNVRSSLVDVTRGSHYLTPSHQPWLERFLRQPPGP